MKDHLELRSLSLSLVPSVFLLCPKSKKPRQKTELIRPLRGQDERMEGRCNDHSENGQKRESVENGVDDPACMYERTTGMEIIREVKRQLWLAGPLSVVTALQFGLQIITLMFVGHLSQSALSGASMAVAFVSVTGTSLLIGTSCVLETLCGQSFGAKQYQMVGIYFQRGMLVQFLVCVICTGIWANTGVILRAVGQDPKISKEAGDFARWLIPGLLGFGMHQCILRFLQTQSIIVPMILTSAITFALHIPMCWAMVFKSGLGSRGAALATSVSFWLNPLLLALYVKVSSSCSRTWTGFSKEALQDMLKYVRLAVPAAVMVCLEIWTYELVFLLSGYLPNPNLETSVLGIILNTSALLYMVTVGLGGAGSTRVSNELGAGHPRAARLATCIVIAIAVVQGIVVGIVLVALRDVWGYAFSKEKEVIRYVAAMTPILAATNFLNAILCVLTGIFRGCGWQKIGACINLGSYYLVGIPCSGLFAFVFHMGGKGLWLGILCAVVVQVTTFLVLVIRTNWEKEVNKAKERVQKPEILTELWQT